MTAPLKWRSQLCPCGYCPDGTRIEWRYDIDIRFKPRRRRESGVKSDVSMGGEGDHIGRAVAAANPSSGR